MNAMTKHDIKKRETLEIIIDTCSLGKNQLEGISRLIERVQHAKPKVFEQVRITIPIQIATETRQRIFPDFLKAELLSRTRHNHLDIFFRDHQDIIRVVETDVSQGYQFLFAKIAVNVLQKQPELKALVLEKAHLLAERYSSIIGPAPRITTADVERFCQAVTTAAATQETALAKSREAATNATMTEEDYRQQAAPHLMERKNLGRHGARFLEGLNLRDQYILQTMYSLPELYKQVSATPEFGRYRKDKGERAIESFLFDKRAESNPQRVTMIVSDDSGARLSIQRLRSHSQNSVFCVSSWGLAVALKQLGLIGSLDAMVSKNVLQSVKERARETQAKLEEGRTITMSNVLEPRIERKWANRLVQVIKFGQWDAREKGYSSPTL